MKNADGETILRDGEVVSKTDPRLEFRGALDSLYADVLCILYESKSWDVPMMVAEEIPTVVWAVNQLVISEAQGKLDALYRVLNEISFIDSRSFTGIDVLNVKPTTVPVAKINKLRTRIRETELAYWKVAEDYPEEFGIVLNWLSRVVFFLVYACEERKETTVD